MIEQRTLLKPGEGIIPPEQAATQHKEYPKHMVHAGYAPGTVGEEVKSPHGFSYHLPGTAIRYPPVLAMNADQEELHKSLGYHSVGKSDPAAFARAALTAAPPVVDYQPEQYPKWVAGKVVNNADEEATALGKLLPPTSSVTELIAASDEQEIADLEAKLAVLRGGKAARIAQLQAELAAEHAEGDEAPAAGPVTSSEAPGDAPALSAEANTLELWPAPTTPPLYPPAPTAVTFREETAPRLTPQQKRAATLARKKAERESAA